MPLCGAGDRMWSFAHKDGHLYILPAMPQLWPLPNLKNDPYYNERDEIILLMLRKKKQNVHFYHWQHSYLIYCFIQRERAL